MQESHGEGVAIHTDPESCGVARKGGIEALTGARAGWVLSCERLTTGADSRVGPSGTPTLLGQAEGTTCCIDNREMLQGPAQSETPRMYGNTSHENREIPSPPAVDGTAGRVGKSKDVRR